MTELDRDNEQFNQGVTHTVELLAKALGVADWVAGDGSEDYDDDLSQTLLNILTVKGLYDPEDGAFGVEPSRVREACDLLAERRYGNPARSPGHNARLLLEGALAPVTNSKSAA